MKNNDESIELPNDLAACHTLIEKLTHEDSRLRDHAETIQRQTAMLAKKQAEIEALTKEKQELQATLAELLQRAFRKNRERYIHDPNQLCLDFDNSADAADATEGLKEAIEESGVQVIAEHTRRPRKPRNEQLPEHLPRYEVIAKSADDVSVCPTHGERTLIGYDSTETLEFERPKLRVRVTKYPKYGCPGEPSCGVASPERATSLVEGNRYDTSVAAEVITGKYGYHLPVYRQQDYFAGSGWTPARSTLLNLLVASTFVIEPLVQHFKQRLLSGGLLGTDDTTVTLLLPETIPKPNPDDPKSERAHEVLSKAKLEDKPSITARMWAYRGMTVPLNVFDFTVSRHRDGPDLFLESFRGKLMADCYTGYQSLELRSDGRIQRAACVAHARRKLIDAQDAYPQQASRLLDQFQRLYDIEDQAKTVSHEERLQLRRTESASVWQAMHEWLISEEADKALPKSKLGKALGYLRNHWDALQLYLNDPLLPIDNNDVEQLMRQVAVGRKNWSAPDVPRRSSGRSDSRDALLAMFERTLAVCSAICI